MAVKVSKNAERAVAEAERLAALRKEARGRTAPMEQEVTVECGTDGSAAATLAGTETRLAKAAQA